MSQDFDLARQIRIAKTHKQLAERLRRQREVSDRYAVVFALTSVVALCIAILYTWHP